MRSEQLFRFREACERAGIRFRAWVVGLHNGELAAELIHEALVKDRAGIAHLYPTELRERYGRYYRIGSVFVRAIGHPPVMRALTEYALPQEWLMRFMLRLMGNLTDGRKGDARDKVMYALERIVPAS